MVEAQSFSMPGATANSFAGNAPVSPPTAKISNRWRTIVLTAIVVVNAAVAIWLCLDVSQMLRAVQANAGAELLGRLTQWRELAITAMAGAGLVLALVTFFGFRVIEAAWGTLLVAHEADWEKRADRWRIHLAEKSLSEEHLIKIRKGLEAEIANLTQANHELTEELNRRKKAERSLSAQRQQLEASKDVLQVHVQARAQELQKLQRQYELILNAAGEGICGVEPGGKITFVNPTAAKLMGLEVPKMVGCNETELFGAVAQSDTVPRSPRSSCARKSARTTGWWAAWSCSRTSPSANNRPKPSCARRTNSPAPTPNSSNSPSSPPMTCRSRCEKSAPSAIASRPSAKPSSRPRAPTIWIACKTPPPACRP
jgi:PAS domain-containing protein